jgi:uncharacterized protein YjaG (DUF416 family)
MTPTLRFDEHALRTQLDQLSQAHRAAFAAACAERLFPAYLHFSQTAQNADPDKLRAALNRLWDDLTGNPMSELELRATAKECEALVPSEEEESSDEQPYGEDAAAALAYALEARFKGSQEAAWSARRAYEALDHFVDFRNGDGIRVTPEEQILEDPLVQAELARQSRDLKELLSVRDQEVREVAARLRDCAKEEPAIVFDRTA